MLDSFIIRSKHYKAALSRFKSVLSNFPDVGFHQQALQYASLCEEIADKRSDKLDKNTLHIYCNIIEKPVLVFEKEK